MSCPIVDEDKVRQVAEELAAKKGSVKPASLKTLEEAARSVSANIRTGKKTLITTGIPDLDYSLEGGFDIGEMVIIGARPSHGKSAIALQMVQHMTRSFPVGVISQEMSLMQLGKRTLQFISEIPQDDWGLNCDLIDEAIDEHFRDREKAWIVNKVENIGELIRVADTMIEEKGIKALFVDYAQMINGKGNTTYEKVSDVSKCLHELAVQTGTLVIALAQLGRDIEKRTEFIPTGRDLKDSGQLEQDADVVLFAVWPHKINPKAERNHYQFFLEKNRNRNRVKHGFDVFFEPERQRYLDASVACINNEYSKDF